MSRSHRVHAARDRLLDMLGPGIVEALDQLIQARVDEAVEDAKRSPWPTPEQAGELLGISKEAVKKRLQRGTLPGQKYEGRWYVDGEALERQFRDTSRDGQEAVPEMGAARLQPPTPRPRRY